MWHNYYSVATVEEALQLLAEHGGRARIVAGATDLILEMERGVRKGIDVLIDVTRVPYLDKIVMDEEEIIHLGPMVTHNHCVASKLILERAFLLAQAASEVGAPQIRNRGTVAGNLITASPANDTIPPLMALNAQVKLATVKGERVVPLSEFYRGVRQTVMQPDEMLMDISFPAMTGNQRAAFVKLGLRRAQAISIVNAAVVVSFSGAPGEGPTNTTVESAKITLGSVAPVIIQARDAQAYLASRQLNETTISHCAELAKGAAQPIDDLRGSAVYRSEMVRVCVSRCLQMIQRRDERAKFPDKPVLLWGGKWNGVTIDKSLHHTAGVPILTRINGVDYKFSSGHNKTLLRLLREEAGLTGTKEGCAEGECGACTVFLDGKAVMSCLVPAGRAHGAEIITVEGLAQNGDLHPVQRAFVEEGAVQCGYCTPGLLMSAVKLLEEQPHPSSSAVRDSITGNLCRCTGYYKILQAVEKASQAEV